jgi:hypothetical protein
MVLASFCILLGIVLAAISRVRPSDGRVGCLNNLKQISLTILQYENALQQGYPRYHDADVPTSSADRKTAANSLGLIVEADICRDFLVFTCPSTGRQPKDSPERWGAYVNWTQYGSPMDYGYDYGHRAADGSEVPLLADSGVEGTNSDNHGKNAGQNIIYLGSLAGAWEDDYTCGYQANDIYAPDFFLQQPDSNGKDSFCQ